MQNHKQDIHVVCHRIQELFQYTHKIEYQKSDLLHTTPTFVSFFFLDSRGTLTNLSKSNRVWGMDYTIHTQSHTTRSIGRGQNMWKLSGVEAR